MHVLSTGLANLLFKEFVFVVLRMLVLRDACKTCSCSKTLWVFLAPQLVDNEFMEAALQNITAFMQPTGNKRLENNIRSRLLRVIVNITADITSMMTNNQQFPQIHAPQPAGNKRNKPSFFAISRGGSTASVKHCNHRTANPRWKQHRKTAEFPRNQQTTP